MKNIKITDVRCQKGDASFLIDNGNTSILYDTGFGFTGYDVADNIKLVLEERKAIMQRLGVGKWQIFGAHGSKKDYSVNS